MNRRQIEKLNRESNAMWESKYDRIEAKVGTVPMSIWVPNTTKLKTGERVQFYEDRWGTKCTGYITKLSQSFSLTDFKEKQ